MKAAIYCRVSTQVQKDDGTSLDTQLEACKQLALERQMQVIQGYCFQEDWGGDTLDRPLLYEVRKCIKTSQIQALICYSVDRLSRSSIHLAILAEECQKRGVELIFVTEPLDTSREGQLLQYVKGYAADIEREKIKDRTMRGLKARAEKGKLPRGGCNLYGYIYNPATGHRTINESQAMVIKEIFESYAQGETIMGIRDRLQGVVIAPRGGKNWSLGTLGRILRNEVYTGKTYARKMKAVEPPPGEYKPKNNKPVRYKKVRRELNPREEWIELPGATPSIITEELFNTVQQKLKRNLELSKRNQQTDYLLSGFIYCKWCDRRYYGQVKHTKDKHYRSYRCASRVSTGYDHDCKNIQISADWLETEVWNQVKDRLKDPSILLHELDKLKTDGVVNRVDLDIIDKQLTKTRRKQASLLDDYLNEVFDRNTLQNKIDNLKNEEQKLIKRKSDAEAILRNVQKFELSEARIKSIYQQLSQRIDRLDFEGKKLAFEALDLKVFIDRKRIEVSGLVPISKEELNEKITSQPLWTLESNNSMHLPFEFTLLRSK